MTPASSWPQVRLGDLFQIKHGFAFKGEFFSDETGAVVLTPGNFHAAGGIKLRPEKDRSYTGIYPPEFKLRPGELLVVMTDLTQEAAILGAPAFVPSDPICLHNQRLGKVTDLDVNRLDSRYLYYVFNSPDYRSEIKATATGSTVRHTSPTRIYDCRVALPPLDTQRRIAGILGAYDDLIEVNRRRVAVLEGQARGLFEEWFVRFHFPGHEHHPLQDTPHGPLPQGWEWTPFSKLARFTNGFAFKPSDFEDGGLPIVKIPELKNGVTAKTPRNSGNRVPKHLYLDTGDLLFSWSGTLAVQPWIDGPALLNQHLFKVDPFETVGRGFLLASLNAAMPRFLLQGVGATMQHIRRSALDNTAVALPGDQALLKRADQFLAGIYADLVNTQSQSRKLAAARDLLLPRLISGQIDLAAAARELETAA